MKNVATYCPELLYFVNGPDGMLAQLSNRDN